MKKLLSLLLVTLLIFTGCGAEAKTDNVTQAPTSEVVKEISTNEKEEVAVETKEEVTAEKNEEVVAETSEEVAAETKEEVVAETKEEVVAETEENVEKANAETPGNVSFEGYELIEVDGGDLSGYRQANVVVDIGFGDREYYAFTNEHGQLVRVIAEEIILQDDENEPVLSTGRYFRDEAKVPGVESKTLDEGHVIADSLGGVSNAYNITPQNSTLNRHGDQAYMEKVIRDAGGCTDFEAIITYADTETQIPSHYSFTYTLKGNVINDEFDNVNPDEVNANNKDEEVTKEPAQETEEVVVTPVEEVKEEGVSEDASLKIVISALDKKAEYVIIKNPTNTDIDISGWKILSVTGGQDFDFASYILKAQSSVKVGDSEKNPDVDFHWLEGRGVWNNSKSDPAQLFDANGNLIYTFND